MSFFNVLVSCFITSLFFYSFGNISNKFFFKIAKDDEVIENYIIGIVSISFLALASNFFVSLNIYYNSIILIICLFYLTRIKKNIIIKTIKYSLLISLISLVTISLDNINRPDAGLYHLPYIRILNEFPIIIGSANLNERFGVNSIIQYISAINLNFVSEENGILTPLVIIYSVVIIFFLEQTLKKENENFLRAISFLFFSFILINMNRYSGFGNDAPVQMFYFLIIFYFLKQCNKININNNYKFLALLSLFAFFIKPFFLIASILVLIFMINNLKNIILFNSSIIFLFFIFLLWLIKNVLVSGCIIYPFELSCLNNLSWVTNTASSFSLESEAWSKGWPDSNKLLNYKDYLIGFGWVFTWIDNHFKLILEKSAPFLILIIILSIVILFRNKINNLKKRKELYQLIIFNFLFLFIWFFSFPAYRFGSGIICTFLSLIFIYLFYNKLNMDDKLFYKTIISLTVILCISILTKNIYRIHNSYNLIYVDYPWPKKNSSNILNTKNENKIIIKNNKFLYYSSENDLCYYNAPPCTHKNINIRKESLLNFYVKYVVDNKD